MDRTPVGTPNPLRIALIYVLAVAVFGVALPAGVLELGGGLDRLLGLPAIPGGWGRAALGGAGVAYGLAWVAWTNRTLVRLGRGYPQEAFGRELLPATRKLVITGPFRRIRNPMVFGVLAALEGLSLAVGSLSALLIIVPGAGLLMASYLRRWEEPGLIERFGADYERYREQVPLIVPRLGRARHA